MKIKDMTKKDFARLPRRPDFMCEVKPFTSLVIIPQDYLHDSGYHCMDFAAVDENDEAFMLLSGGSDVLHIDGIGGYGCLRDVATNGVPTTRPVQAWAMDCLPCGYLRLWCNGRIRVGGAFSSFEIFWEPMTQEIGKECDRLIKLADGDYDGDMMSSPFDEGRRW